MSAIEFQAADRPELPPLQILVVEDDEARRDVLVRQLLLDGHFVESARNGIVALQKIDARNYDVVVTDRSISAMNDELLADEIKKRQSIVGIVFLIGAGDADSDSDSHESIDVVLGRSLTRDRLRASLVKARNAARPVKAST